MLSKCLSFSSQSSSCGLFLLKSLSASSAFLVQSHEYCSKLAKNSLTLFLVPQMEPVKRRITLTISLSLAIQSQKGSRSSSGQSFQFQFCTRLVDLRTWEAARLIADCTSSNEGFKIDSPLSRCTFTSKKGLSTCLGAFLRPQIRSFIWLSEYLVACKRA